MAALVLVTGPARADEVAEARAQYRKGLAAFALGAYAEAAQRYERAFALKPDPALLYNAAQASRLAGQTQRALLLYESYVRSYRSENDNLADAQRHIAELRRAIADEVHSSPPQEQGRQWRELAVSATARGEFSAAAQGYEMAFALDPEAMLLEEAARAHLRAGNRQRALLLYQHYLLLYGAEVADAAEVRQQIVELKLAVMSAPPTDGTDAPGGVAAASPATPTPPLPSVPAAALSASAPAPVRADRALARKPWFWGALGAGGAVVIAGLAVGLSVGLHKNPSDPVPTLGAATVN